MDAIVEAIVDILRGYGLPGAAILYLMYEKWQADRRIATLTERALERETRTTEILTEMLILVRALGRD